MCNPQNSIYNPDFNNIFRVGVVCARSDFRNRTGDTVGNHSEKILQIYIKESHRNETHLLTYSLSGGKGQRNCYWYWGLSRISWDGWIIAPTSSDASGVPTNRCDWIEKHSCLRDWTISFCAFKFSFWVRLGLVTFLDRGTPELRKSNSQWVVRPVVLIWCFYSAESMTMTLVIHL